MTLFANTIGVSDVEVKDHEDRCDLCNSRIFVGINLDSWFVCSSCGLNYTENNLRIELQHEEELSRLVMNRSTRNGNGNIGMCMECGELSEHSDLCSRNSLSLDNARNLGDE